MCIFRNMIFPFMLKWPNTQNIIYSNMDGKQEETIFIRPLTNNGELRYETAVGRHTVSDCMANVKLAIFISKEVTHFSYSPQKQNRSLEVVC